MIVFFDGQFLPKDEVRISPDDRGFLFADGAYEVVRVYQGQPFLMDEHLRRLRYSLGELKFAPELHIPLPEGETLDDIARELIRRNDLAQGEATIYIQVTRGVAPRKHAFPAGSTPPTLYVAASAFSSPREALQEGVSVILVPDTRWARCDVKSVALLPNVLASQAAAVQGAKEAILVRDRVITEGAHSNVCAVFDGVLFTHPATHRILAGITRGLVLELCAERGIPYREEAIGLDALAEASEVMIVGTTTEIMPVISVDGRPVADGRPGPVTRRLQGAFRARVEAALH